MKAEEIIKVWNNYWTDYFSFKGNVTADEICDWLIWNDGLYFNPDVIPMFQGTMTQRMNEIAMDMILRGDY